MTNETLPDWTYCPICTNVLEEAVVTADGHCYCDTCISDWFRRHDQRVEDRFTSGKLKRLDDFPLRGPVTNLPLETRVLYEVIPLRQAVTDVSVGELAELRAQVRPSVAKHFLKRSWYHRENNFLSSYRRCVPKMSAPLPGEGPSYSARGRVARERGAACSYAEGRVTAICV